MEAPVFQRPTAKPVPAALMLQAAKFVTAPALQLARVVALDFHEAPGGYFALKAIVLHVHGADDDGGARWDDVGVVVFTA